MYKVTPIDKRLSVLVARKNRFHRWYEDRKPEPVPDRPDQRDINSKRPPRKHGELHRMAGNRFSSRKPAYRCHDMPDYPVIEDNTFTEASLDLFGADFNRQYGLLPFLCLKTDPEPAAGKTIEFFQ